LISSVPARADLLIKVDKSAQQMTVTEDGHLLYTWPVSTGRAGYNTPSGAYTPFRMDRDHFSREWDDAPMPYSIFFTKEGHAIHGTNEVNHLGHAVSHGCVRLSVQHAAVLWDLVKKDTMAHTSVVLTGKIPAGNEGLVARARPRRDQNSDFARANDDGEYGDQVASAPPPRQYYYGGSGWQDDRYPAPRYYYRDQPEQDQPEYDRPRGFFPFGW
jgi:hypothetical protein